MKRLLHRAGSDLANENERPNPTASVRADFGNRTSSGNGATRGDEGGWTRNQRRFFETEECAHRARGDKTRLYRRRHIVDRIGGRHGSERQSRRLAIRAG